MTLKVQGLMLPSREVSTITVTAVVDDVAANSIAIYTGATVSDQRQVETINAWRFLVNGMRDRNILQQFAGIVYSGVDIDDISEASRRTDSVLANFTDNDIIIGVSAEVAIEFGDWVGMLDVGFGVLSDTALEGTLKVA
jgi:hypothetical protein